MNRGISILKDHYRYLSVPELIALSWNALFKNERILIYCISLQKYSMVDRNDDTPFLIVKGELADLESARKQLQRVPWEFKCDLYDGVKDFFVFRESEDGAIGHISWLYFNEDPNRTLRLGDKECEIMFCLTLPEFRGKGLYPSALQTIVRYLKGRGYERCFICATDDNVASIRGIEKSGFHLAGRTHLRKVFGFQISGRCDTRHLKETSGD